MALQSVPISYRRFLFILVLGLLMLPSLVSLQAKTGDQAPAPQNAAGSDQIGGQGLMGYISSKALQPSAGLETGYVPIVTRQEIVK